ncbi:KUP/HAK/KT family potassium transporter [Jiella sp. MQZ9-1]|uniref:Probable potassium transport system protein Kup n=1 Tax=Jiella flava TaxID=2816857 RepID=A0A939G2D3_9HYPH|nr:KUP/HAK/KT family potassium transporter [Jiella flava]MBO0664303.1 KUP/HAK/KT family potassium transporter [Jiella flava]MCD2472774.1 KUP/HAK/KT family potassium transporter [Jiella flava]
MIDTPFGANQSSAFGFSGHRADPTLVLTIGALGVVFGDIGTSPLYAFRVALQASGSAGQSAVFGVLSLILWALILVVTIKYLFWILRVDNAGEGGILALAALLRLDRRHEMKPRTVFLLAVALAGGALLFGDAVLTPAISVLSAVEGLGEITSSLNHLIVPVALAIVVGLFAVQFLGTGRIGKAFGPIMLAWFAMLAVSGIIQIAKVPEVLVAVSPSYAIVLLVDHPAIAAAICGAVFLAVTGGEALYADLGQFGRTAINRAWLYIAFPALALNYFGQGALVLSGRVTGSTFYSLFGPSVLPIAVALATLASIIASQAVITGIASLASQSMRLDFLPSMRIQYFSPTNPHDLLTPAVNTLVGVCTALVVITFRSSDALSNAYGIAVAGAMLSTTILYLAYRLTKRGKGLWRVVSISITTAFLLGDLAFVTANFGKLEAGGLLPVALAVAVTFLAVSWRFGQLRMARLQEGEEQGLRDYLKGCANRPATTTRSAVFLVRRGANIPRTLVEMTDLAETRFARTVLVSVRTRAIPRVSQEDRIQLTQIRDDLTRIVVNVGYLQRINLPSLIAGELQGLGADPEETVYIVGLERPISPSIFSKPLGLLLFAYAAMARLALRPSDRFNLPPTRTLEVGMPRYL